MGFFPLGSGLNLTAQQLKNAVPQFSNISFPIQNLSNSSLPNNFQPIPIHINNYLNPFENKSYYR
jgi:hypothetical protein